MVCCADIGLLLLEFFKQGVEVTPELIPESLFLAAPECAGRAPIGLQGFCLGDGLAALRQMDQLAGGANQLHFFDFNSLVMSLHNTIGLIQG